MLRQCVLWIVDYVFFCPFLPQRFNGTYNFCDFSHYLIRPRQTRLQSLCSHLATPPAQLYQIHHHRFDRRLCPSNFGHSVFMRDSWLSLVAFDEIVVVTLPPLL